MHIRFRVILAVIMATMPLQAARASCPRTTGEKTRRLIVAIGLWPAAPFIYLRGQTKVPMPAPGTRVRISHEKNGPVQFTSGTFVSAADSALRIVTANADTVVVPFDQARCLQVYRRSRPLGFGVGFATGPLVGGMTGLLAAALSSPSDASAPETGMFLGAAAGSVIGPLIGAVRGATAWDVAWERPSR